MADPSSSPLSDKDVKAHHVFDKMNEEKEEKLQGEKHLDHHHKETYGLRDDIDETTPISDVKAPNVFERANEEIQAIVHAIHPNKESNIHGGLSSQCETRVAKEEKLESHSEKDAQTPNLFERAKEEIETMVHKPKSPHRRHKETHGRSDDIDINTPIDEVKGPTVFERAKEEIEALIEAIHPKKDDNVVTSPKKAGGLRLSIGKGLERVCSPWGHKKD